MPRGGVDKTYCSKLLSKLNEQIQYSRVYKFHPLFPCVESENEICYE